jgi:hypothetical protein
MSRGAPEERPADPSPKDLRAYSVILAAEIGEPAAQMFHRIWYFCIRATSGGRVIRGRRWIRNSHQQWKSDHFPHWSLSTVRRALKTLLDKKLIRAANHNREKHVNTQWYTVNPGDPLLTKAGYVQNEQACSKRAGAMLKKSRGGVQNEQVGVFKMSTSDHRDHIEDNQSRPSSHPDDEQRQKPQAKSRARGEDRGNGYGISADSGPEEGVSVEAERDKVILPPDPSDDLLNQIYGRVPPAVDFSAAPPKSVNLNHYLRPFQNREAMKKLFPEKVFRLMEKPGPDALEAKCAAFVDRVLRDHFKNPGQGAKTMALRACRGGFLNRCGFKDFCGREFYNRMEYSDANAVEIEL